MILSTRKLFKDNYEQGFYEIGMIYLSKYQEGKIELDILKNAQIPKEILSTLYAIMVKNKMLVPVEKLTKEEKETIWNEAKQYAVGMNKANQQKIWKSVYVLNKLSQLEMEKC